jgi:hypothetical protein
VLAIRLANRLPEVTALLRLRIKDLLVVLVVEVHPELQTVQAEVVAVERLLLVVMERTQVLVVMVALVSYQLLQVLPVQLMLAVAAAGHAIFLIPVQPVLVALVVVEQVLLALETVR